MATDAERIAELERDNQQLRLAQAAPEQRGAIQTQIQAEQDNAANVAERARLNQAARVIHSKELAIEHSLDEAKLLENGETLQSMDTWALTQVGERQAAEIAGLIERVPAAVGDPAPPVDPNAVPAPGAAPGTAAIPTAAGATPGAAAAALGTDPVATLLSDEKIGRGSGNLEGYMERHDAEVPFETVTIGRTAVTVGTPPPTPAPPPAAPAPAATPAAPAAAAADPAQPAPAPAVAPAPAPSQP